MCYDAICNTHRSCDSNKLNAYLHQWRLSKSTPHSDLEDLKRTADSSTQFDSALTSAIKREREVTVKTEAMRALHKNLGKEVLLDFMFFSFVRFDLM
jgi:hypothetical protein